MRLELLKKLGRSFRDAHIRLLALKGMALLGHEYGNIADRDMIDMDLMVHPDDRDRAIGLLKENDARVFEFPPELELNPEYYHTIYVFNVGKCSMHVELHTGFVNDVWYPIDYGRIIESADLHPLEELAELDVRRPRPEHMLMHLAVHRIKHSYDPDQRDTQSGLRILEKNDIDINLLAGDAREWKIGTVMYVFLLHLRTHCMEYHGQKKCIRPIEEAIRRLEPSPVRRTLMSFFVDPECPDIWKIPVEGHEKRILILFWLFSDELHSALWMPAYTAVWRAKRFIKNLSAR